MLNLCAAIVGYCLGIIYFIKNMCCVDAEEGRIAGQHYSDIKANTLLRKLPRIVGKKQIIVRALY